ncbi:MAG: hypothetical protein IPP72_16905 [Chitinophagaceae bacterium]|nr:hypothetical protein [Chitinophagaceae bacterium]
MKYGITEKKKAELDKLAIQITDAQFEVDQYQAMVDSLTDKQGNFQAMLVYADQNRTRTLNNKNLLDQVVKMVTDLVVSSGIAATEIQKAQKWTGVELGPQMKKVVDELIYSAEMINKLANMVVRAKALNPLISDIMVNKITTAGKDANNAVALCLVELSSTFASQSANKESEATLKLEYKQAVEVWTALTNFPIPTVAKSNPNVVLIPEKQVDASKKELKLSNEFTLFGLLYNAYTTARGYYDKVNTALNIVTKELNEATSKLSAAQVLLNSLQLEYAAGNAAAMAS